MGNELQEVLQVSAKLYEKLTSDPVDSERDDFIQALNQLLEEREQSIAKLLETDYVFDSSSKVHRTLFELDKGIRERLDRVFSTIKQDMKDLQTTKRSEQQYTNPYASVQVMDGMYYDKKK